MLHKMLAGFCALLAVAFYATAAEPTVNDLIDGYGKSLSVLARSAYEIETQMVIKGAQSAEHPSFLLRKAIVRRDGDRWDAIVEDRYSFPPNLLKPDEVSRSGSIVDYYSAYWATDHNEPVEMVYVDYDLAKGRAKTRAALGGGIVTEGWLPGNGGVQLPDILRSSALNVRNDRPVIDGYPTIVLESQGKTGKTTLWLDPESGFHPRRIEVHKSGEDLLDGQSLSSAEPSKGNAIFPRKPLSGYSFVVESANIEKIAGVFVTTAAKVAETWAFCDAPPVCISYDFRRSKINLNPDFSALKAFEIKVPDGTPAYNLAFQADNFMVVGGRVVPVDDPAQ